MNLFLSISLALTALITSGTVKPEMPDMSNIYTKTAIVESVDVANDIVTVEDIDGYLWDFYGSENFNVGDMVDMLMDNNNTSTIFDDAIIFVSKT